MRRLTENELSEEVLSNLDFNYFGEKKDKIIKKINELYQYCPKCFASTNRGDYKLLKNLIEKEIYILKHIN